MANTPETTAPAAAVRTFRLSGTSKINGKTMDIRRIDVAVPAGTTELWWLENPGIPHSFHIHEVSFRILDINGKPPPRYARGRKDTVYLPPGSTVRLAVGSAPTPTRTTRTCTTATCSNTKTTVSGKSAVPS